MRIHSTPASVPDSASGTTQTTHAERVDPATVDSGRPPESTVYRAYVPPAASDDALVARIDRINAAVESGGRGVVPSRLVTTAGAGSPASYGRSQLLVSLQVDGLLRHAGQPGGAASLERLGVSVEDLRGIDLRGRAAVSWYDAIVRQRFGGDAPLDRGAALEIRRRAAAGDLDAIVAKHGAAFEASTGIPARELGFLALTTRLVDPSISAEYRRLRGHHGQAESLDRLVAHHPELGRLREHVADDRSLDFFLRRPRRNGEHRAAWYTRAARVDPGQYDRLVAGLIAGGDRITTAERNRRNVAVARAYVDRLDGTRGLAPDQRALLIGQLSRIQHGNPAFFRDTFGSSEHPTIRSVAELERRIDQMMKAPAHSTEGDQGRSVRAFTVRFQRPETASIGTRLLTP